MAKRNSLSTECLVVDDSLILGRLFLRLVRKDLRRNAKAFNSVDSVSDPPSLLSQSASIRIG